MILLGLKNFFTLLKTSQFQGISLVSSGFFYDSSSGMDAMDFLLEPVIILTKQWSEKVKLKL